MTAWHAQLNDDIEPHVLLLTVASTNRMHLHCVQRSNRIFDKQLQ